MFQLSSQIYLPRNELVFSWYKKANAHMVADAGGVLADSYHEPGKSLEIRDPALVSGPSAGDCVSFLNHFGYNASLCGPEVEQLLQSK